MRYLIFALSLLCLSVYTWGFVDSNAPFAHITTLRSLVYDHRAASSAIYIGVLLMLFGWYAYIWRTSALRQLYIYIGVLVGVLFFSFPAFSNDIFNYIATAKVTYLYQENPYLVMPIDIPNEPMLRFLQAANKTALYGPSWIGITVVPYMLGFGNVLATMYAMKAVIVTFYLAMVYLIWKLTHRVVAVLMFAFNPLVIIDTLVSAHNDVVMMFFALLAFYLVQKKKPIWAGLFLLLSIFVKGATLFLVPVFVYVLFQKRIDWERVWTMSMYSMFIIFMLSPLREEMYSWYFIWVFTFVALRKKLDLTAFVALGFTFGLSLRFLPFVYTREWGGVTPIIKKIVTFIPPVISGLAYTYARR